MTIGQTKEAERRIEDCAKETATELDLSGLGLKRLPESMQTLRHVQKLELSRNLFVTLPDWLRRFSRLRELQLWGNGPIALPDWLAELKALEVLSIGHSPEISGCEYIPRIQSLRRLWIEEAGQTMFPEWLRSMTKLVELRINCSRLIQLPEWIGDLKELREISLHENQLTHLPLSFAKLQNLNKLYLSENNFATVPGVLHELPKLRTLSLQGNLRLQLPEEVIQSRDASTILTYAKKLTELGGKRALNEAKLILVGRGAVGKTTLVHQLVHEKFVAKHKTRGIKVSQWEVPGEAGDVTAHVWDFGGQEIMHGTHQFFLTERSLYVLVLAGREDREDEDAEYWLKMIAAFGGDSPVIVVLNKFKEHRFTLNDELLREKYPNIRTFIETDCKTNLGIRKLRKAVIEEINRMDSIRAVFPSSWFEIKDRLSTMPEPYMPFDRFREVCAEYGEKNAKDQVELAKFLHILGIALNYRDDPRLSETSVLNPKWVTEGIYRLLNDERIRQRSGVLRPADLGRVLDPKHYPVAMHDFLVRLMKKFDLCYPLDDEGRDYLIPELLGKKQPKLWDEFAIGKCLCFEYHYGGLLPEGLLPRFIVRAYTRIVDDLRWRTGVVLSWGNARALVKADEAERQVLVRVHGRPVFGERRMGVDPPPHGYAALELLEIIRDHFDEIHRNFKKLEPDEKIRVPELPQLLVDYGKVTSFAGKYVPEYWKGQWHHISPRELLSQFDLHFATSSESTNAR